MLLWICFIGVPIVCIINCKMFSLNSKIRELIYELKEKADKIVVKYNPNLNSRGKHATAAVNDLFLNSKKGTFHKSLISRLFFV